MGNQCHGHGTFVDGIAMHFLLRMSGVERLADATFKNASSAKKCVPLSYIPGMFHFSTAEYGGIGKLTSPELTSLQKTI